MKRSFEKVSVAGALIAAIIAIPAWAGGGADADAESLERRIARGDHRGFVSIIELNYYLLTEYAKNAGSDLRFRLSDFKTYRSDDFGKLIYGDLATVTDGLTIHVVRRTRTDQSKGRRSIELAPAWKEARQEALAGYSDRAFRDVLADVIADRQEMAGQLQAVTTFQVRAEMSGRSREYRAAFLWSADQGPKGSWINLRLLPLDGITRGLDQALSSPLPPQGRRIEPVLAGEAPLKTSCTAGQTIESPSHKFRRGQDRHWNGSHYGEYGSSFRCSCSSSCTSTCEPWGSYTECWDDGIARTGFHVTEEAYDDSVIVRQAARTEGAECASAYICAVKQCSFPNCSYAVSVTVSGLNASFAHAGTFWQFKATFGATCAPCEALAEGPGSGPPPVENPDPDPGGSGSGSGGAGPICTLICSGNPPEIPWQCEYRCW